MFSTTPIKHRPIRRSIVIVLPRFNIATVPLLNRFSGNWHTWQIFRPNLTITYGWWAGRRNGYMAYSVGASENQPSEYHHHTLRGVVYGFQPAYWPSKFLSHPGRPPNDPTAVCDWLCKVCNMTVAPSLSGHQVPPAGPYLSILSVLWSHRTVPVSTPAPAPGTAAHPRPPHTRWRRRCRLSSTFLQITEVWEHRTPSFVSPHHSHIRTHSVSQSSQEGPERHWQVPGGIGGVSVLSADPEITTILNGTVFFWKVPIRLS